MRLAPSQAMLPKTFSVSRLRPENHDTFTVELQASDALPFAFEAGQFNMLYLFGVGEVPISISGDPSRPRRLVHTTRQVGAVTKAMRQLRRGSGIGVRGPFGRPWPLAQAHGRNLLLVAGGVGLAPLRPVLYSVAAMRNEFHHVTLLYGARSPDDLLFREDLQHWQNACDIEVEMTVDHGHPTWPGHVGVVTSLITRAGVDAPTTTAFVCGPEIMMRFAAEALRKRGVPATSIFVSLERNMKCAVGLCGHCQFGGLFVCKDGPVFPYQDVKSLLELREI